MSSVFNKALEWATNPQMPSPRSPLRTPNSPSNPSTLFQDKIKDTIVTVPGPCPPLTSRPPTPRPDPAIDCNVYASGALPRLSLFPTKDTMLEEIPIPKFRSSTSTRTSPLYISNYPEDEVDWSEPTPPPPAPKDTGPCRNFRDPHTAAEEERDRHFAKHGRERWEKLVAGSNTLRDAPALSHTGATKRDEQAAFESTNDVFEADGNRGWAGEPDSVYVPGSWRNQRASEDDLFSDVAENGGVNDDDDEQWDEEFARAEDEVSVEGGNVLEGGHEVGHEDRGLHTRPEIKVENVAPKNNTAPATEARAAKTRLPDAANATVTISTDPAVAPYVKHTTITANRYWAYPAPGGPSPTESQLAASGFEFHNELSETEQITHFGDKAFRKALREVLPSLSRKQQWYAWQRVNQKISEDSVVYGEGETSEESLLKEEMKDEGGESLCKCPGNGEECDGDSGTCGKLLSECLCGDCEDCSEHYRWHRPDGACETEGESGEQHKGDGIPKCGSSEGKVEGGDAHTESCRQPVTSTSVCGCGGSGKICRCLPDRCTREDCNGNQAQHPQPGLNPEVKDRPSDWTGSFPHGRLIDGESAKKVREGLDEGHDVPAQSVTRIPGLDLLDQSSDPRPTHYEIRMSVEPETPRRQLHRESTPAFEDRSPSPSPVSHKGNIEDVEMTDAPAATTSAPKNSCLPLPQPTSSPDPISSPIHAVTAPQTPARQSRSRSRSPSKAPVAPPDPVTSTPKSTKRGGRRKSTVHGSKVEKASTTKDKSRAVSRKVAAAVKDAAEKAGNKVKEAVAKIEASVKEKEEHTPRRSQRIRAKIEREGTPSYGDD